MSAVIEFPRRIDDRLRQTEVEGRNQLAQIAAQSERRREERRHRRNDRDPEPPRAA